MIEYFGTLGAVVVLALGSLVPGFVGGNAERALAERFPGTHPHVRVEADPFLQLPFGHLARVAVDLDGAEAGPIAIPELDVEARDVRVPPAAVWGRARPDLLAPAPVTVRLGGTADAWRASLARAVTGGKLTDVPLPKTPLGPLAGKGGAPEAFELTFEPGRLGAKLAMPGKGGARLEVVFSFAPTIASDGRRLVMGEPRVKIGDKELPAVLARLAAAAPLVDLADRGLPGRDWKFVRFDVSEAGLWIELAGVLEELPPSPLGGEGNLF